MVNRKNSTRTKRSSCRVGRSGKGQHRNTEEQWSAKLNWAGNWRSSSEWSTCPALVAAAAVAASHSVHLHCAIYHLLMVRSTASSSRRDDHSTAPALYNTARLSTASSRACMHPICRILQFESNSWVAAKSGLLQLWVSLGEQQFYLLFLLFCFYFLFWFFCCLPTESSFWFLLAVAYYFLLQSTFIAAAEQMNSNNFFQLIF